MPASDEEWDWKLTDPAEREYETVVALPILNSP